MVLPQPGKDFPVEQFRLLDQALNIRFSCHAGRIVLCLIPERAVAIEKIRPLCLGRPDDERQALYRNEVGGRSG